MHLLAWVDDRQGPIQVISEKNQYCVEAQAQRIKHDMAVQFSELNEKLSMLKEGMQKDIAWKLKWPDLVSCDDSIKIWADQIKETKSHLEKVQLLM